MDSLSRAKQFIAKRASKLALMAIPLAAIAVSLPAKAGVILETGSNCSAYGTSGSCSTTQAASTGTNTGLNWVQLYGSVYASSGGYTALEIPSGGGGTNGAYFSGGSIPIAWDFSVSTTVDPEFSWDVYADFYNLSGDYIGGFYQSGSGFTGTPVSGSGSFSLSGSYIGSYDMGVEVYENASIAYALNVPGDASIDLNGGVAGTPEPSTLLMGPLGGGLLLLLKRRKRSS